MLDWRGNQKSKKITQVVQVTDIGMSVKESFDYSHIWLHSLSTGKPLPNSKVEFYDEYNLVGSGKTDGMGYCRIRNSKNDLLQRTIYVASTPRIANV